MITWPYQKVELGVWMPLLGSGIGITFTPGSTLHDVLCDRLAIPPSYLTNRIQTILVNGHAIDEPKEVYLSHGDTVALSAAMPGLVGTTLKRGSHLAAMRRDITLKTEIRVTANGSSSILTLKLFNMVAAELGSGILSGQVYVRSRDLNYLSRHYPTLAPPEGSADPDAWVEMGLPNHG